MKYTILTLGNAERQPYMDKIRQQMYGHEEVFVDCVDGKTDQLQENIDRHGFDIGMEIWRPGEGGVWYSNINAWTLAAESADDLMVFEDDAVVSRFFKDAINHVTLPEEYDFVTFYLPYFNGLQVARFKLVPSYQEHGMVCMMYSPTGAAKILDRLRTTGINWPVDIWLFKEANAGYLNGYGPSDISRHIVTVDYKVPTNIHEDERIKVTRPHAV